MLRFFGDEFIKASQTPALADYDVAPQNWAHCAEAGAVSFPDATQAGGHMNRDQLGIAVSRFLLHVLAVAASERGS